MKQALSALTTAMCTAIMVAGCATTARKPWVSPAADPRGEVLFRTASATGEDPLAAGRKAALALQRELGEVSPRAVLVMESYEDLDSKRFLLRGVTSVFAKDVVFGGSSYGGFTQRGSVDWDGVVLLGIAGNGVGVSAALSPTMGTAGLSLEKNEQELTRALNRGGRLLAYQLAGHANGALLLLIGDAHSPKNQLLIDGVQSVVGKKLPITGGSICKNEGQNWVYYRGKPYTDSAVGLLLTGPFRACQVGRQAKSNEKVIATAREGSEAALKRTSGEPSLLLAFNCGGRKGKLSRLEDELEAIQASAGTRVPVFGAYCAGEFGPADTAGSGEDLTPCGRGWHVMFTALGK